jgi:anti-anti-sigma factor
MLTILYNSAENLLLCKFSGRLDTIACASLNEEVENNLLKLKKGNPGFIDAKIVFDLSEVNYIASSFIRICVNTAKQSLPGNFSIVNCEPFIKKTFKIAGLDEILGII